MILEYLKDRNFLRNIIFLSFVVSITTILLLSITEIYGSLTTLIPRDFLLGEVIKKDIKSNSKILVKYRDFTNQEIDNFINQVIFKNGRSKVKFYVYTIKRGDNFWTIARDNNIKIDTILGSNPFLKSIYAYEGQKIIIPSENGIIHIKSDFEKFSDIATFYNIPQEKIIESNGFSKIRLFFGNEDDGIVFVPDVIPRCFTVGLYKYFLKRYLFISPIGGRYTSGFGWRRHPIYHVKKFHKGLDIAAPIGTMISASADGTVICAGWVKGYGKYIRIKHKKGYLTGYGHLSHIYVKKGQRVKKGQIIGRTGQTGVATGPHLDFTIKRYNKYLNPALYLW